MRYVSTRFTPSGDPVPEGIPLADAGQALEQFGQLRKLPRQARSEALIDALKQAARNLLEREGRSALTLTRLSEYAGVGASSIYEYFPSMDSLVDVLFIDYCVEAGKRMQADMQALPLEAGLFEGIRLITRQALALRRRLHAIDPDTNGRQVRYYEALRLLPADTPYQPPVDGAARLLFKRFCGPIECGAAQKRLYLFCRTLHLVVRTIAIERPQYLSDDDTLMTIASMLHNLFLQSDKPDEAIEGPVKSW